MSFSRSVTALLAALSLQPLFVDGVHALAIGADFIGDYTATDLGTIAGLPAPYGGMVFKADDPNSLLIGGAANSASGLFYETQVIRDASNHITGFGALSAFGSVGEYNDGGIAYGPGGVLFTTQWPENNLGQTMPGSTDEDKIIDLGSLGITDDDSISGLNFVPAGFSGTGSMKAVSWSGGSWWDIVLAPDGAGTYDILSAALEAVLPGGPEAFVFIDDEGNPGFSVDSLLIADYSDGSISAYDLDADANPIVNTRRTFIDDLTGAQGAVIDPLTGDFLFSTFGGGDRIVRVEGFAPPPGSCGNPGQPECPVSAPPPLLLLGLGLALLGMFRRNNA